MKEEGLRCLKEQCTGEGRSFDRFFFFFNEGKTEEEDSGRSLLTEISQILYSTPVGINRGKIN